MKRITIAIDGYSSCGKSTMAKALAKQLGYIYIDTGAMYRSVTLYALEHQLIVTQSPSVGASSVDASAASTSNVAITPGVQVDALIAALPQIQVGFTVTGSVLLNQQKVDAQIRSMEVSSWVSKVSAIPQVREKMVALQREMGANKGVVLDGRDIGTVVFPHAELKIFVTAAPEIRAQRRYLEMKAKGQEVPFEEILKNVQQRDYEDEHRAVSPLTQAPDAVVLDNGQMSIDEQNAWLLEKVQTLCKE